MAFIAVQHVGGSDHPLGTAIDLDAAVKATKLWLFGAIQSIEYNIIADVEIEVAVEIEIEKCSTGTERVSAYGSPLSMVCKSIAPTIHVQCVRAVVG